MWILPKDIILDLQSYIENKTVINLFLLNKRFRKIINTSSRWYQIIYFFYFGVSIPCSLNQSKETFLRHKGYICRKDLHKLIDIHWGIKYCRCCHVNIQMDGTIIHPIIGTLRNVT